MSTTVVNIKTREPFDVYVGRACPRARDPRCHKSSEFCNAFRLGRDGATHEVILRKFERSLRVYLTNRPKARERLLALEGKRLGCWCAPEPCHAHVLIKLIGELRAGLEPIRDELGDADDLRARVTCGQVFTYYGDSRAITWHQNTIASEVPAWAGPAIVAALNRSTSDVGGAMHAAMAQERHSRKGSRA